VKYDSKYFLAKTSYKKMLLSHKMNIERPLGTLWKEYEAVT